MLIEQQIQELRARSHIQKIKRINQYSYAITYSPTLTQSPYSHLVFTVKMVLPQKYPEHPPYLSFNDKIYHLNIDPISGQVFMPILKDDWSPFLTLSAVFDSLNNLLEEPEVDYSACETLRLEYLNQPERYAQKVSQMVNICTNQRIEQEQGNESVAEHVEEIIEFRSQGSNGKQMSSNQKELMHEQSEELIGLKKSIELYDERPSQQSPLVDKLIKIQSEQNSNRISQIKIEKNEHITLNGEVKQAIKASKVGRNNVADGQETKEQFDEVQQSLRKSDQLIEILLIGCESMENTLKNSSNERVRKILQKKLQDQWVMVEQLLDMTSKLKQKLFNNLKAQTKQLLK